MSSTNATAQVGTTGFTPGWHPGVPMQKYLADPAASASLLWKFHQETPAHVRAELDGRVVEGPTAATDLGEVVHSRVFEPEAFDSRYVIVGQCEAVKKGDGERCSHAGKFYRDGHSYCGTGGHDPEKGAPMPDGIHVVQEEARDCANSAAAALAKHPIAKALLLVPGPREVVGVTQDPKTGLWLRIRPDLPIADPESLDPTFHWSAVDLKGTSKSAAPEEFRFPRDFLNLGHYFKAAFYRMALREIWGMEPQNFYYPVVELYEPFEVVVYRLSENWLDIGEFEVRAALDRLAECVGSGVWPGYAPYIRDLQPPAWQMKQVANFEGLEFASGGEVVHV